MDRVQPKQILQENDTPVIASFGGLSSTSYNTTGDIVYLDKLVNAYVDKAGQLRKRKGSITNAALTWTDGTIGVGVHRFKFDGVFYLLIKVGDTLTLYASNDGRNYNTACQKQFVFNNLARNDKPTFATKIEGNLCHILIAMPSNQLVSFTIVKSTMTATVVGSTMTGNISVQVNGVNVINVNNCIARTTTPLLGIYFPLAVTHNNSSFSFTGTFVNQIPTGTIVDVHSFFWLRYCDASYYPGFYLTNSALRRNTLPLDVNVAMPQELATNPLINDPVFNPYIESAKVYANSVLQTKVGTRNPTAITEWDFSDGSYYTGAGLLTNPTPAFISFGGLVAGGQNTTISINRLRPVVISGAAIADIEVFVDKITRVATYYDSNGTVIGAGAPYYFSLATSNVLLNLSSVVEIVDKRNFSGAGAANTVADLDESTGRYIINDGYCVPLYGYNFVINNRFFPSIVSVVGNRIILAGSDSRIIFSNSDWNYRGFTFNNCQISTIGFSANSAFSVNLSQGSSEIRGVNSVNGVLVVATDIGIFRISSSETTQPPTADNAVVSRVSNEVLPNNDCFNIFDNRVFYVSSNGLFQLEYNQDKDELANASMSTHVSNKFTNVNALTYSEELRSFLVTFSDTNEIVAMSLDSESWYSIKFATSAKPAIERGNDGFYFIANDGALTQSLLSCQWDNASTNDVSNLGGFFPLDLPGRSVNITQAPTNVDALVCPAELLKLLSPANIVLSPGSNHARTVGETSVSIVESVAGVQPLPVTAYAVSKVFLTDRMDRANRVRSVNLMLTESVGSFSIAFVQPTNDLVDRAQTVETYLIGTNEMGEPLLNNEFPAYQIRASAGNTNNVKIRSTGISEGWAVALKFNGVGIAGLQFDTSVKSRRRLR